MSCKARSLAAPAALKDRLMRLGQPLLDALERLGCGGAILDADGAVVQLNQTGKRLVLEQTGAEPHELESADGSRAAMHRLLHEHTTQFRLTPGRWSLVSREGRRQLVLH